MNLRHLLFALPVATFVGYASSPEEADAAYSGTIGRTVCGVAAVPRFVDRGYLDYTNACALVVKDTVSSVTYRYAAVTVPVERKTSTANISTTIKLGSDGSNGFSPGACAQAFTWDTDGTVEGTSAAECAQDGGGYITVLTLDLLTLPIDGAVSVSLAGIDSVVWHRVSHGWTANGT